MDIGVSSKDYDKFVPTEGNEAEYLKMRGFKLVKWLIIKMIG